MFIIISIARDCDLFKAGKCVTNIKIVKHVSLVYRSVLKQAQCIKPVKLYDYIT